MFYSLDKLMVTDAFRRTDALPTELHKTLRSCGGARTRDPLFDNRFLSTQTDVFSLWIIDGDGEPFGRCSTN